MVGSQEQSPDSQIPLEHFSACTQLKSVGTFVWHSNFLHICGTALNGTQEGFGFEHHQQ